MKLRTAVTELAGDRTASVLAEAVGTETAQLVEELRQARDDDYWNTRIRLRPSKIGPLTVAQFHSTAGPLCRWAACQSGEPAVWDGLPPLETQRRQPPERRTARVIGMFIAYRPIREPLHQDLAVDRPAGLPTRFAGASAHSARLRSA